MTQRKKGKLVFRMVIVILTIFLFGYNSLYAVQTQKSLQKNYYSQFVPDRGITLSKQQEISLNVNNIPLLSVLKQLAQKARMGISYQEDMIPDKKVTLHIKGVSVYQALHDILKGTRLKVVLPFSQDVLVVKKKELKTDIQQETITGTVTDAQTGDPLVGVNILVIGTSTGTATDADGHYSLTISDNADSLRFSYIGYQTKTIPINGRTKVNVTMKPTVLSAKQVVVVGYGTQKKKNLTGSISSVSAKEIENQPTTTVFNAIQGQTAGVQVTPNSGAPGTVASVQIRGQGTLGNSSPLIVVNGNPVANAAAINPENIKSVQVLKDASAAAIYGSRGANGVILITTKGGTTNTSSVKFNMYYGFQRVPHKINLTNATQYAKTYNKILINGGKKPVFANPEQLGKGTDWQSKIFRTAPMGSYNLSFTGGNDNTTYNIGGGYFSQEGIIKNSDFRRATFTVNTTHHIKSWLTVGENLNYLYSRNRSVPNSQSSMVNNVVGEAIGAAPTYPVRDNNGEFAGPTKNSTYNPVAALTFHNPISHSRNLLGNIHGIIDLTKGLTFHSQFNVQMSNSYYKNYVPPYNVTPFQVNQLSSLSETASKSIFWAFRNTATFKRSFGKQSIKILAGLTTQDSHSNSLGGSGQKLPVGAINNVSLRYLALATTGITNTSGASEFTMISYFGRVNYNYNDRYLLEATIRRDGSSKFGKNNRFGTFPAFSAGWVLSNEAFMPKVNWLSGLKLRGSWGKLGNQNALSNYAFLSTLKSKIPLSMGTNQNVPVFTQTPSSIQNPNLRWETVKEWDIGIDLRLVRNSIHLTADYYNRTTDGLLVRIPIPDLAGVPIAPFQNAGNIVNKGFELTGKYQNTTPGDFFYSIGAHLTTLHNEVTKLANKGAAFMSGTVQSGSTFIQRTAVGHPIKSFYGYVTDGIFQTEADIKKANAIDGDPSTAYEPAAVPGDIRFKDIDGDGEITSADKTYIGKKFPTITYGGNVSLEYKNIDLALLIVGESGNSVFSAWQFQSSIQSDYFNYYAPVMLNSWHGEGTSNSVPRLTITDPNNNGRISNRFVQDASYMRIRSVQVGYTLPVELTNKLSIKKLRLYINARNLYTFTGFVGYDPKVGVFDYGRYPEARTFTFGVNLTF